MTTERIVASILSLIFATGTVVAYQVTNQAEIAAAGTVFTAACLYRALNLDIF